MDSAGRYFAFLVGASVTFGAYGACGLILYALLPLGSGEAGASPVLGAVALALLIVLVGTSLALGGRAAWRHRTANARLVRWIDSTAAAPGPELRAAAREAGLEGRVVLLRRAEVVSFVYGTLVPRVAISTGMLARLSPPQLRAALAHERYHVRNLDPLRELVARVLAAALFFLPLAAAMQRRYAVERELAADRRAAAICGRRQLAGALLAALESPDPEPRTSIALAGSALLSSRLSQLETGRPPSPGSVGGPFSARRSRCRRSSPS